MSSKTSCKKLKKKKKKKKKKDKKQQVLWLSSAVAEWPEQSMRRKHSEWVGERAYAQKTVS